MPSDPRVTRLLELVAEPIEQYRSSVAATLEEVRGYLAAGRSDAQARAERLQEQLGVFGGSRIDVSRMSALLGNDAALDASALRRLEQASAALRSVMDRGGSLFHVDVPPGADAAACVKRQLAAIGRGFAAARIAGAARNNAASGLDEASALEAFPYGDWNAAERRLAPPLVVSVNGTDLVAGALAPFIDGTQKILIVVDGPCAPAPLARLITPGVLVLQAHDVKDLEVVANWPAAAVGALVPIWAARFTHDPAAGPESWQRMTVHLSRDWRIKRIGGLTSAQQHEELAQLQALASQPAPPVAATTPVPATSADVDPADRLAAWLLQQANLTGPLASD